MIRSVEHVEVLMLLYGDSARFWLSAEIADELRRAPRSVQRCLGDLQRAKLVLTNEQGAFAYRTGSHDEVVAELQREFEVRRVRLIEAIYTGGIDPARSFADAFRLWENDREDDR